MSRSLKKGPYIDFKLEKKVEKLNNANKKEVVKIHFESKSILLTSCFVLSKINLYSLIFNSDCSLNLFAFSG